jgi:ubiquinone/menaquinone biosynthesis C-methylase UbiE
MAVLPGTLEESVDIVGGPWRESAYYEDAERWTFLFWNSEHAFRPFFDQLDLTSVVELASGYGRHAEKAAPLAGRITLMDIHEENLAVCRKRLSGFENVDFVLNNGFDFRPIPDESLTAIYCYDAMVHFSQDLVGSYLRDATRVLRPGGRALLHHSNYNGPAMEHYGLHPMARNVMPRGCFDKLAHDAGLSVIRNQIISWGDVPELDRISLLEKPA